MEERGNETGDSVQNPAETETIPLKAKDEHWKLIFQKYDKNSDGYIDVKELDGLIHSPEYENDLPQHVVAKIHELADTNEDGRLDFEEFLDMIHHPNLQQVFRNLVNRYVHMLIPRQRTALTQKWDLTQNMKEIEDEYDCCPPPIGIMIISLMEIILFFINEAEASTMPAVGPIATALIYDPHKRYEAWRYITYMFIHIGYMHLVFNLCVQVILGIPLELLHKWWRVLIIYFAGVAAGSLGSSITDPTTKLAGASGGVYAILTAHIASIILNWKEMEYPEVQIVIWFIIIGCDFGTAIYDRSILDVNEPISYAAHLAGAAAGLLVGINILRNIKVTPAERVIWWISIITYILLMVTAIVWNAAYIDYFPAQNFRKL